MWLSHSSLIMRPSIPDWLEVLGQKLQDDDPNLTTLEVSHQRIDDAQARFLADSLTGNTNVSVFILSCHSIVDDGALALAALLGTNQYIKKIQLRDLRNSRELITFFRSLARNRTIEEFSLRHCTIGLESSMYLYNLLENHPTIQEFRLIDSQLVGGSVSQVCKALQNNESLHRLYVVNAEFEAISGAKSLNSMLEKNCSLTELHACENSLGDSGAVILTEGLQKNSSLRKLDLRSNGIGMEGAISIAKMLQANHTLVGLHLGMNDIGNVGAEALAQGLCTSVLEKLDLSDNGIDAEGALALASMLRINKSLHELNLAFNSIGDTGAASIAEVLEFNSTLKYLSLRRNYIGNKGAYAFARKLPTMRGLKELVMIKNSIDDNGAEALLKGLSLNVELEYLHVEDKVSEPILREIVHWIRLNRAGRRIFRNTNLPSTLWPEVLSRINKVDGIDCLYFFLSQKPDVFQHAKKCRFSSL